MSVQNVFDHRADAARTASDQRGSRRHAPCDRFVSKHIVSSLATGLRARYDAAPDNPVPDVFADLIARLHAVESRLG